jgi:hypothetical protein
VGPLTPPSNKLKSGCWPLATLRLGAPIEHAVFLCPLPTNAAFNRPLPPSPESPQNFARLLPTASRIPATQAISRSGDWEALVTSSQADFSASRCLGGKTWCEAGEGLRKPWHPGLGHHSASVTMAVSADAPRLVACLMMLTDSARFSTCLHPSPAKSRRRRRIPCPVRAPHYPNGRPRMRFGRRASS